MKRRAVVASALALAACGGGGAAPARTLSAGDSLASGQIATAAGAPLEYLPVRPAQRLQDALGPRAAVVDAAQAGQLAFDGLRALPGLLAGRGYTIAVLRWGGADAVKGTPLDVLQDSFLAMVDLCSRAEVRPVLVGMPRWVELEAALAGVDTVIRRVASVTRTPFADTWAVSPGAIVGGHPDSAYSAALMAPIAETVRRLL